MGRSKTSEVLSGSAIEVMRRIERKGDFAVTTRHVSHTERTLLDRLATRGLVFTAQIGTKLAFALTKAGREALAEVAS